MLHYIPRRYHTPKWQAIVTPQDQSFNFSDGTVVHNLFDLKQALTVVSDASLNQHVNDSIHQIADWLEHSVKDTELAMRIRKQNHRWGMIVSLERQMMRTLDLPPYVAKRWLKPATDPFTFVDGTRVNSIEDLSRVLESVNDETVQFHLERVPNDISAWVFSVIGNFKLAEILADCSNRSQMQRYTADHIVMLKDAVDN